MTEKKLPELSVFFPFWNEEKNIEKVVHNALPVIKQSAKEWELLLIDDGSSDKTLEKAKEIARNIRNVKVITHSPNRGYGSALKEGFTHSKYKYIVFTDGDGQFDMQELPKFIEQIRMHDIVIGYRKERKDELSRHVLMNMLKVWDSIFFRFYYRDIDCGFKMFKKNAVDQISPLRSEGAMITTEILAKAKARNLSIAQVAVSHYPRKHGKQTGANVPVVMRAIFESHILWWDIRNNRF